METHESKQAPLPDDGSDKANGDDLVIVLDDTLEAATPAEGNGAPPNGTRRLLLVGVTGALIGAGLVSGLAFSRVRAVAPADTSRPVATAPAPAAPAVESAPAPTWTGDRRAARESDGSKTISFTLAATRELPVWMSWAQPVLAVRCQYQATDAFVLLDTSASFEDDADRRTVHIQWDDGSMAEQRWNVSESGRELFAPDAPAFIRQMAGAHTLRFGFTPFNAQPVTAEFAVQGFDQLAGLVANACKWPLDGTTKATQNTGSDR